MAKNILRLCHFFLASFNEIIEYKSYGKRTVWFFFYNHCYFFLSFMTIIETILTLFQYYSSKVILIDIKTGVEYITTKIKYRDRNTKLHLNVKENV